MILLHGRIVRARGTRLLIDTASVASKPYPHLRVLLRNHRATHGEHTTAIQTPPQVYRSLTKPNDGPISISGLPLSQDGTNSCFSDALHPCAAALHPYTAALASCLVSSIPSKHSLDKEAKTTIHSSCAMFSACRVQTLGGGQRRTASRNSKPVNTLTAATYETIR